MPSELTLYNAQQCSNPFIVDSTLEHMDYLTKGPLPESVGSGLTTVASQFNYTSLYWKEVKAADQSAGPTAAPHCIMTLEGIDLVHVSQLSVEQQKKLLTTISRHVLMGSLKTPFIYCHRRWLLSKKVALTEPVGRDDIPLADARDQPLLWVDTSLVESYEGAPIQRYRQVKRFYYNSSQLTPFQSTDELEQKAELTSDSPE
ncbi:hypothetical protein AGDE_11439 [Angomonas deanei]|uniref:Uncharacterized protein n=1 Tax=Angomonas deanei TaxID=59799 RepID=A0A7G2CLV4_9TRYP|nr:hypothetical protein AGDE_11439 [Angomonas deanei]CAD2220828.1 hypothetical protein, conserved [Angomonas deanei]|eukprot:EPY26302.1 hypothetical protein AGDE_11439 [Angomonas deanei]